MQLIRIVNNLDAARHGKSRRALARFLGERVAMAR
jgi:hypothetical protein